MTHKAERGIEEGPYCFPRPLVQFQGHIGQIRSPGRSRLSNPSDLPCSRSYVKFWGHTWQKSRQFCPKLSVSGVELQFELTDGFEIMHNACYNIEEVPYCFSRSFIKLPSHTVQKINDLNPILSKNTRLVATIKSLRFSLLFFKYFSPNCDIIFCKSVFIHVIPLNISLPNILTYSSTFSLFLSSNHVFCNKLWICLLGLLLTICYCILP